MLRVTPLTHFSTDANGFVGHILKSVHQLFRGLFFFPPPYFLICGQALQPAEALRPADRLTPEPERRLVWGRNRSRPIPGIGRL